MGTVITRSTSDDLPALLPLLHGYSSFYGAAPQDDALLAMARAFCEDGPDGLQLVAREESGRLVGFATLLWSWDTTSASRIAVMEDLFVADGTRGQGVGRLLLEACAERARERGCPALSWMTAPGNTRAQRLYDATGAERSSWLTYRLSLREPGKD
ncbi:GNAT family N-acetyltransferase [Pedococcus sp. 2YAF34]|uniref:GNAT family N-acetyltransferase n=1 Tax=Pedococcus sp. 2YAF34 TaxID=3233032 RepID=UPI003F955975